MLLGSRKLSVPQKAELLRSHWRGATARCAKHRSNFTVTFAPGVHRDTLIFTCRRGGEALRFNQTPKQIEFSEVRMKNLARDVVLGDTKKVYCPQDGKRLVIWRSPARHVPTDYDYKFVCPNCFSSGQWINQPRALEPKQAKEDEKEKPPFKDPEMPLPKRMRLAEGKDLTTKLYAAMAQTDCTACGFDCEGYARALATGEEKDASLCVPGAKETESELVKLLLAAGQTA